MKYNRSIGLSVEECYMQHADLIYKLANQNKGVLKNANSLSYEDIVQIAIVGFLKAYVQYDMRYNTKFSTFAHDKIRWELSNVLKNRYLIHFPDSFCYMWNIANKYSLTKSNMDELLKRKPRNMSAESLKSAMTWMGFNVPSSLDSKITNDSDNKEKELYDSVIGHTLDESTVIVNDFLNTLTEKECKVTLLLMKGMKQAEIAKELNHSQPHVNRLIKNIRKQWMEYTKEVDA